MESYCVYDRERTPDVPGSTAIITTQNGRKRIQSICVKCGKLKSRFVKNQDGGIIGSKSILLPSSMRNRDA